MTLLDISIVNVALPAIKTGLHAQENQLEWIVSGYALAFGLLLVPAGRLGDARGRRSVFMTGVALFVTRQRGLRSVAPQQPFSSSPASSRGWPAAWSHHR